MNVFEDLIEELREEKLLEETVIDLKQPEDTGSEANGDGSTGGDAPVTTVSTGGTAGGDPESTASSADPSAGPESDRDFYRKRATDEVSCLQMVEHILSAIERDHMETVPPAYDNLQAKKALHRFLQVEGDPTTTEYAEAEFQLMEETEAWSTVLSNRDVNIAVSSLRKFCENSRPALSSQALISLARFYRNAAYTELSRAKFDLVMTRLFSKETRDQKRRLLFSRPEMIGHIRTLYARWASVALYSADDSMQVGAVVAGFEDRLAESERFETLDQLVKTSFFDKVHEFKVATGEMFFTPEIVAAAIDCNIRIGNKFVDLIARERQRTNLDSVEQKYGYEYDQMISDAAGRTFNLVEVLKNLPEEELIVEEGWVPDTEPQPARPKVVVKEKSSSRLARPSSLFRVNKWLLAVTILVLLGSLGVFYWANDSITDTTIAESANDIDLSGSELGQFLRTGRATAETFYAITLPAWDELPEDQKKEVLQKAVVFASQKGLNNVRLINVRGDLAAFSSKTRTEILNPIP